MPMKSPPYPGRLVKTSIGELCVSVAEAATALGISRAQLHRIVGCESSISPEMAIRLEAVIGSTADAWLRLQAAHDAAAIRARADEITRGLKRIVAPAA